MIWRLSLRPGGGTLVMEKQKHEKNENENENGGKGEMMEGTHTHKRGQKKGTVTLKCSIGVRSLWFGPRKSHCGFFVC
jgi:hypothetical protein